MTDQLSDIKKLIEEGNLDKAEQALKSFIADENIHELKDGAYYLLGNVFRKKGNWQLALNNYMEAIELNPESPAKQAKEMIMDILNFYNKDMFNQ